MTAAHVLPSRPLTLDDVTRLAEDDETHRYELSVALAVEVVSVGSERADRWTKPLEYAAVGIPHFWRVEPDETVLQFELRDGVYAKAGEITLADLLAGEVPDLG